MFDPIVYRRRRALLRENVPDGLVLFSGLSPSPINFAANPHPFRQDSCFLYYTGLNRPDCALMIDPETRRDTLYGPERTLEDALWSGPSPSLPELAMEAGLERTGTPGQLSAAIHKAQAAGRRVHYLPPYRPDQLLALSRLLGLPPDQVHDGASCTLIRAVVSQRSVKSPAEVAEIESALGLSRKLFQTLVAHLRRENTGMALSGILEGVARSNGRRMAFPPIITCRGEILHSAPDNQPFPSTGLLLMDIGAESRLYYASDITRTLPVCGRFTPRQKDIYEIVLAAQEAAVAQAAPGVRFVDVHLKAAATLCEGLRDLGLMKGPVADAVREGAHAMFFPHGLGHMLGLDVHDMEALGEDHVGYDRETARSDQFGRAALRLGRRLEVGFVVTVEPGIYFIPALIDRWRQDRRWSRFIAFDKLAAYRRFGGIRIEDVIHITPQGSRFLGPAIPKSTATVEAACQA